MALQWTSTLAVGVPELDSQHQELFRRIDRLLDAVLRQDRSEAGRLLEFLGGYVRDHFAAEERLMAEVSYPDAERHVREHRDFARRLAELDAQFAAGGATAALVFALERQAVGWRASMAAIAQSHEGQPTPSTGSSSGTPHASRTKSWSPTSSTMQATPAVNNSDSAIRVSSISACGGIGCPMTVSSRTSVVEIR